MKSYALVHLVAQELTKELIGPQVLDHAASQLREPGGNAPAIVAAAFLEPVRHALTITARRWLGAHAARDAGVKVRLLPYVSRLSLRRNSVVLAHRLRKLTNDLPLVLHCRGESAVKWAIALAPHFRFCAVVSDIRGAWPEELLFARGFNSWEDADSGSRQAHDSAERDVRLATTASGAVLSVSPGMLEWLRRIGVPSEKLYYVPCCVANVSYDENERQRSRERLGLVGRMIFCYMGTITRYQHVPDGVLPFFRAAASQASDAHLLCITPQVDEMRALVEQAGLPAGRVTIVSAGQREVGAYLAAADAGLLLRAPSKLNLYSQPTKLGEYLAAGVPVIVARGTGQVDALIDRERAGAVITAFGLSEVELQEEALKVCEELRSCADVWRRNAISLCRRHFVWSAHTQLVREAYVQALNTTNARQPGRSLQ